MRPSYLAGGKQSQAAQYQVPASLRFFLFNNNEPCHLLPTEMPDVLCAQQSPSALKNLAKALWAGQPCPGCEKYVSHLNCPQDSNPVYRCLQQHWLPLRTKCSFPSRAQQINIVWELVITFFFFLNTQVTCFRTLTCLQLGSACDPSLKLDSYRGIRGGNRWLLQ